MQHFRSLSLSCQSIVSCHLVTVPFASCAELDLDSWVADFDGHFSCSVVYVCPEVEVNVLRWLVFLRFCCGWVGR